MLLPTHPLPHGHKKDEMNDSEEEYHETLQDFSESNLVAENEGMNSKDQEKDISLSYTPYEEEIKESPPNMQEEFSQNKEELEEENNFENKENSHCIEEEHCQDIASETRILNVEKEEKENVFKKEISHLTEDSNTLGQPRVDYIEYWFKSIVIPPMQTSLLHTLLDPIVVHFGHAPDFHALDSFVAAPIFFLLLEPISQVNWMLEWLHWKSTYT
jgi:hypothetical protein